MFRTRYLLPGLIGVLLLTLAACDSTSSNVGVGLVEEGGALVVRELTPTVVEQTPFNDVTGAVPRVLAGKVTDPLVGTITTTGFVDFTTTFDTTDATTITSVTLRLARDYVYGDTTATVSLNLRTLDDDWTSLGTHADTTLSIGDLITSFSFAPTDTFVTVALPEAWIAANDTTLRSSFFSTDFHGFAMEAVSAETVVGFDFSSSDLRVITEADTFDFGLTRTLTGIVRDDTPTLPDGLLLVQDGAGPNVKLNFDLSAFDEMPLNGAIVRFFADTLTVQAAPPNFVRPLLQTVQLVRITDDESAFFIGEATLDADGHYRFSDPFLNDFFQQIVFGQDLFDHLELRVPINDNTLNVMLLHDAAAGEKAPEALLTLSP